MLLGLADIEDNGFDRTAPAGCAAEFVVGDEAANFLRGGSVGRSEHVVHRRLEDVGLEVTPVEFPLLADPSQFLGEVFRLVYERMLLIEAGDVGKFGIEPRRILAPEPSEGGDFEMSVLGRRQDDLADRRMHAELDVALPRRLLDLLALQELNAAAARSAGTVLFGEVVAHERAGDGIEVVTDPVCSRRVQVGHCVGERHRMNLSGRDAGASGCHQVFVEGMGFGGHRRGRCRAFRLADVADAPDHDERTFDAGVFLLDAHLVEHGGKVTLDAVAVGSRERGLVARAAVKRISHA